MDATQDYWAFLSIQKVGLSGLMRGEGIPVAWANETRFYPERVVGKMDLFEILSRSDQMSTEQINQALSTVGNSREWTVENGLEFFEELSQKSEAPTTLELSTQSQTRSRSTYYERVVRFFNEHEVEVNSPLTRASLAVLIHYYFDPFYSNSVQIGYSNSKL